MIPALPITSESCCDGVALDGLVGQTKLHKIPHTLQGFLPTLAVSSATILGWICPVDLLSFLQESSSSCKMSFSHSEKWLPRQVQPSFCWSCLKGDVHLSWQTLLTTLRSYSAFISLALKAAKLLPKLRADGNC